MGVNWSLFTKSMLVEIGECIGGEGLAKICDIYSQTYWSHRGGVPDLCLWKHAELKFKLVEVKVSNEYESILKHSCGFNSNIHFRAKVTD